MGFVQSPIVKLARRFIAKHGLTIPFDLDGLVKLYAQIVYMPIPEEGVDGICVNLKRAGKRPRVIVNTNSPTTRQRFTLAHELGHIIIPWHIGNIVDEIEEVETAHNTRYWEMEGEANRFASEILMPFDWIFTCYKKNSNRRNLLYKLITQCHVSEQAASIRLDTAITEIEHIILPDTLILQTYAEQKDLALVQQKLVALTKLSPAKVAQFMVQKFPGRIAYCIEKNGNVVSSGSSGTVRGYYQFEGAKFFETPYPCYTNYAVASINNMNTHWWNLDFSLPIVHENRPWREILDDMLNGYDLEIKRKLIARINGKVSGCFSVWKNKHGIVNMEKFIEHVTHNFNDVEFSSLILHPSFTAFLKRRSEELFEAHASK